MTIALHAKRVGAGFPVILLHGLFGSGANLGALARHLQASYTVYSVDLPNHGRSSWLPAPDLPSMADCVLRWMDAEGLSRAIFVGHSLGGKVAMELALRAPQRVAALVVADIAPVAYPPRHASVFAALRAVTAARCIRRNDAAAILDDHLEEEGVALFLQMGLAARDGVLDWRFDRAGLEASYTDLIAAPAGGRFYTGPTLFIKGGDSDYIKEEQRDAVLALFPAATLREIPGAGHWLHAEKPEQFNGAVARFLASVREGSAAPCT